MPGIMLRDRALPGVFAVAMLLFGTRWISYLGHEPFFLTDALLLAAAVGVILAGWPHGSAWARGLSPWLILATTWALVRFATGPDHSMSALRDYAPFLYIGVGLIAGSATAFIGAVGIFRTGRILEYAVYGHGLWNALSAVFPTLPEALPLISRDQQLWVFTIRSDIDSAVSGIAAALCVRIVVFGRGWRPPLAAAGLVVFASAIFLNGSRAGLLGASALVALVLLRSITAADVPRSRVLFVLGALPYVATLAVAQIAATGIGDRILGTFGMASSERSMGAAGTAQARMKAWEAIVSWFLSTNERIHLGAGFGINFMSASGADYKLVGTREVGQTIPRSPHNFWLTLLARLGLWYALLIALIIIVSICLGGWMWWRCSHSTLLLIVFGISLTVPITSSLGVVLESPFGAVPFWWAVGVILGGRLEFAERCPPH